MTDVISLKPITTENTESSPTDEKWEHQQTSAPRWDLPRFIPPNLLEDNDDPPCLKRLTKAFKIIVYMVAFSIVLTSAVANQLSFAAIGAQMYYSANKSKRIVWNCAVLLILLVPKIFLLTKCLLRKSRSKTSSFPIFLVIGTGEIIGAVGDSLLMFKVLPETPSLAIPFLFLALGWAPGILRTFMAATIRLSRLRCIHRIVTPVATVLLVAVPIYIYMLIPSGSGRSKEYYCCVIFGTVFSSIRWWPSFFYLKDGRPPDAQPQTQVLSKVLLHSKIMFVKHCCYIFIDRKKVKWYLLDVVKDLENCRYRIYIYISIIQILIYAGLCNFFLPSALMSNSAMYRQAFSQIPSMLYELRWVLINCIAAYVTYVTGKAMCKVAMQVIGFSMPLTISPFVVCLFLYLYEVKMTPQNAAAYVQFFSTQLVVFDWNTWRKFIFWVFTLGMMVCQMVTASHIFKPCQKKRNTGDSLFSTPLYEGSCVVQSLIYGRKGLDEGETDDPEIRSKHLPMIYMCATMWHETVEEMQQLFVSIFRTDMKQGSIGKSKHNKKAKSSSKYDFEVHILFDDAFTTKYDERTGQYIRVINSYVQNLGVAINNAAELVLRTKKSILNPPTRYLTPYGGQLVFKTPYNKLIVVHLKDKTKVRNKKRWSQIMYMYYLLTRKITLKMKSAEKYNNTTNYHKHFLDLLTKDCREKLKNTFILMLDGDIDWKPSAIQLLLNDLLKNEETGAVCARIMPSGVGPFVWYQMIEYAIQHWLAKTMENIFGCVLCTPGCFSLFRASTILDDNVMKAYSKTAVEASELVQYDQGEDRWLCTLILQCRSGYRVNYCAASSAVASSPITFSEFLNQRRRWIPSSLINHLDFIKNGYEMTKYNKNITILYLILQVISFVSNVTAPAFIMIYLPSALTFGGMSLKTAYAIVIIPTIIHLIVCMSCVKETQVLVTALLSWFLCLFFTMAYATSIFSVIYESANFAHYFIIVLSATNVIAGLLHPFEAFNLLFLPFYVIGTIMMYLLFFNFALCNINDTGWGTREGKAAAAAAENKKNIIFRTKDALFEYWERLISPKLAAKFKDPAAVPLLEEKNESKTHAQHTTTATTTDEAAIEAAIAAAELKKIALEKKAEDKKMLDTYTKSPNMCWTDDDTQLEYENDKELYMLSVEENQFWNDFIPKYIAPMDLKDEDKKATHQKLTDFRNEVVIGYCFITTLLVVAQYQIILISQQLDFSVHINMGVGYLRLDYMTLCFLFIYLSQIMFQVAGMVYHRIGTLTEYLSITELGKATTTSKNAQRQMFAKKVRLDLERGESKSAAARTSSIPYDNMSIGPNGSIKADDEMIDDEIIDDENDKDDDIDDSMSIKQNESSKEDNEIIEDSEDDDDDEDSEIIDSENDEDLDDQWAAKQKSLSKTDDEVFYNQDHSQNSPSTLRLRGMSL